jgi:UDP-N-acetylglucosamine 2-epimerase (hydrolysing)
MAKNILFLTGTRADFGKLKPLILKVDASPNFEYSLFVTGMHTLSRYGYTVDEVYKAIGDHRLSQGFRSVHTYVNQGHSEPMELVLANTINGLSRYVNEFRPDMIVVHGDRVEALAGATVGALRNILVAHVEGGELSGTVDELIRHAVSKLAHVHFVANDEAANRLRQLGENPESVFIIGSPDIDVMLSHDLPSLEEVKRYYNIGFNEYGLVIFHPVTTDLEETARVSEEIVSVILSSETNFVVVFPNNDEGCELIFSAYEKLKGVPRVAMFPSLRIEYFLTLLKNGLFVLGNSSAGVREAPVYGVYSINVESRQLNRFNHPSIINVDGTGESIKNAIEIIKGQPQRKPVYHFGDGNSAESFLSVLDNDKLWEIPKQKQFIDIES